MWLLRLCETVSLANRLHGRSVCVAAARHAGGRKENLRTALVRDLRQVRGGICRIMQPRRRVQLPGRILV